MKHRSAELHGALHTFLLRFDDGSDIYPAGLALAPGGDLVIASSLGHCVCRLSPAGAFERVAGSGMPGFADGRPETARFNNPKSVAVAPDGAILVADCDNHSVRRIDPETRAVSTLAGRGVPGFEDGAGRDATLRSPRGLALEADGSLLVAAMNSVRRVAPDGTTTTVAKHGIAAEGAAPAVGFLGGIATDPRYGILVTDSTHHDVLRIDASGAVERIAGGNGAGQSDGPWKDASFNKPRGIAVDGLGRVLVADSKNDALRVLLPAGTTETVRGEDVGVDHGFDYPVGLVVGPSGSVYLADQLNNRIYRIVL